MAEEQTALKQAKKRTLRCRPAKFKVGDRVRSLGGDEGIITAVGVYEVWKNGRWNAIGLTYRLRKNQYWSEWQLRRVPS